ncbi:rod shape-determining protein RodA [Candidatus Dojkabacteria bacterium]|uniref:Rod shape-determining protein RodA n=1 Tax=Candidatus Dojkabacteria bacterium TaxID=2099670 RepID=A0A955L7H2_9BACT|nr:rod shape-determining protein RodA [Candidatus Dojkabacteria bacterium]
MFTKSLFKNHDWIITILTIVLLIIGTATIYSTTYTATNVLQGQGLFSKQLLLLVLGIIVYLSMSFFDFHWLKEHKVLIPLYITLLCLLVYVKWFTPEIASTNRWISIGPVNIQPAEYAKIGIILFSSAIFVLGCKENWKKIEIAHTENTLGPWTSTQTSQPQKSHKLSPQLFNTSDGIIKIFISIVVISPFLALIFIQPSLGNTLISLIIWASLSLLFYPNKKELFAFGLLLTIGIATFLLLDLNSSLILKITGVTVTLLGTFLIGKTLRPRIVLLLLALLIGFVSIPIANYTWNEVLAPYQKTRIETFLNPMSDPQGAGWQVRQSQIAIGSGRVFGKGFLQGTQSNHHILPFAHTDFIFAAFAEQFGFTGSIALLIVLLLLPYRVYLLGLQTSDSYGKYICYGVGSMLLTHIIINVGMNLGIMPVTGIPLPLVSYGGSSILVTLIALGLVQNIRKYEIETEDVVRLG